jgi:serine/threonine protein kinase
MKHNLRKKKEYKKMIEKLNIARSLSAKQYHIGGDYTAAYTYRDENDPDNIQCKYDAIPKHTLGSGSFGSVVMCEPVSGNKLYTIKLFRNSSTVPTQLDHFRDECTRELKNLQILADNEFIIKVVGQHCANPWNFIMLEYGGQSLHNIGQHIHTVPPELRQVYVPYLLSLQTITLYKINQLHKQYKIYHADLHYRNILVLVVEQNGQIYIRTVIIDLGVSVAYKQYIDDNNLNPLIGLNPPISESVGLFSTPVITGQVYIHSPFSYFSNEIINRLCDQQHIHEAMLNILLISDLYAAAVSFCMCMIPNKDDNNPTVRYYEFIYPHELQLYTLEPQYRKAMIPNIWQSAYPPPPPPPPPPGIPPPPPNMPPNTHNLPPYILTPLPPPDIDTMIIVFDEFITHFNLRNIKPLNESQNLVKSQFSNMQRLCDKVAANSHRALSFTTDQERIQPSQYEHIYRMMLILDNKYKQYLTELNIFRCGQLTHYISRDGNIISKYNTSEAFKNMMAYQPKSGSVVINFVNNVVRELNGGPITSLPIRDVQPGRLLKLLSNVEVDKIIPVVNDKRLYVQVPNEFKQMYEQIGGKVILYSDGTISDEQINTTSYIHYHRPLS